MYIWLEGASMLYEQFLEDEYIKNIYKGIEGNKRIPISHGLPHILNVIGYCKRLAELFSVAYNRRPILYLVQCNRCRK